MLKYKLVDHLVFRKVRTLLGGRFRDKVRFYRTFSTAPQTHPEDPRSWGEQAAMARADNPYGFTAFKFQGDAVPRTADPDFAEACAAAVWTPRGLPWSAVKS